MSEEKKIYERIIKELSAVKDKIGEEKYEKITTILSSVSDQPQTLHNYLVGFVKQKKEDPNARIIFLHALTDAKIKQLPDILKETINDGNIEVVRESILISGSVMDKKFANKILPFTEEKYDLETRITAVIGISMLGDSEKLLKLMDGRLKLVAISTAWRCGKEVVPKLAELALNDKKNIYREEAVDSLAKINDERVLPMMIKCLSDPSENVRRTVLRELYLVDTKEAISRSKVALKDDSEIVRCVAVLNLGKAQETSAISALTERLKDKNETPEVKIESISALYNIYKIEPSAIKGIVFAGQDEHPGVRKWAMDVLTTVRTAKEMEAKFVMKH